MTTSMVKKRSIWVFEPKRGDPEPQVSQLVSQLFVRLTGMWTE